MTATECDQCNAVVNDQRAGTVCDYCHEGIMREIEACPDCGQRNERRGHMTCAYPTDEQEFRL